MGHSKDMLGIWQFGLAWLGVAVGHAANHQNPKMYSFSVLYRLSLPFFFEIMLTPLSGVTRALQMW